MSVSKTPAMSTSLVEYQPQPLSVMNMNRTNMYSAGGMTPSSSKNTHFLINPNINNSTVHFHFRGNQRTIV